jgi:hypothetical protein
MPFLCQSRSRTPGPPHADVWAPEHAVEVILRLLIVRRFYCWSNAKTEYFVADSLVPRPCC